MWLAIFTLIDLKQNIWFRVDFCIGEIIIGCIIFVVNSVLLCQTKYKLILIYLTSHFSNRYKFTEYIDMNLQQLYIIKNKSKLVISLILKYSIY